MRQSLFYMFAIIAATSGAAPCHAADVAKGRDIAANGTTTGVPPCAACHGGKGEGQPASGIPRLAGIDAAYLQSQLAAFKSGARQNAMMSPIAKTMDVATMAEAAAYYASLEAPAAAPPPQPTAQIDAGRELATNGDWSAKLPPCASCHGTNGLGVDSAFPPIAGQSATYITNQLTAWKNGARHDDPLGLMKTVAGRLGDAQIAAVSAYYATLPGRPAAEEGTP